VQSLFPRMGAGLSLEVQGKDFMAEKKDRPLIQAGGLSVEEIKNAIVKSTAENRSLVESVLADDRVSEEGLADSLAAYARFPRVNLASANIDPEAVKLLSQEMARRYFCIPIRVEGRHVLVAMANPTDYRAMQEIEFTVGKPLKVLVCTRTEISDAIEKYYEPEDSLRAFTENLEDARDFKIVVGDGREGADVDLSEVRGQAELPPVIKVVNLIIQDAITQRATDIHVEPTLNDVQVRVRVDGVLRSLMQLPKWLANPVSSRLKVLARLDIAERRLPQDGRMKVQRENNTYDLRVSTLPTLFGEKAVLRILSSGTELPTLENVNLEPQDLKHLMRALTQPQGLILVTGPTGSGKSTTLYASLGYRKSPEVNIVTVEDPVEYQMMGLNQVQVNVKAGLTFAHCLRSILRQDPDVILVGEMRDLETIGTALLAAETGHLVFSTLHTLDAVETIQRIIAVFPPPEQKQIRLQLASTLKAVVSQRLVRKSDEVGRVPAVEVLISTAFVRDCIINPDKTRMIREAISAGTSQYGMQTFDQSLYDLYTQELITLDEALNNASNADDFRLRIQGIRSTADAAREEMQSAIDTFEGDRMRQR